MILNEREFFSLKNSKCYLSKLRINGSRHNLELLIILHKFCVHTLQEMGAKLNTRSSKP